MQELRANRDPQSAVWTKGDSVPITDPSTFLEWNHAMENEYVRVYCRAGGIEVYCKKSRIFREMSLSHSSFRFVYQLQTWGDTRTRFGVTFVQRNVRYIADLLMKDDSFVAERIRVPRYAPLAIDALFSTLYFCSFIVTNSESVLQVEAFVYPVGLDEFYEERPPLKKRRTYARACRAHWISTVHELEQPLFRARLKLPQPYDYIRAFVPFGTTLCCLLTNEQRNALFVLS